MKPKKLSTESYKGVRDFYPQDQFLQNYILGVMKKVVERFGYVEYSASILESAELYRGKTSEEIVNEQTYTFTDRGEREVTLRPEMTPTIARMIAGKRHELPFPLRWFSIPNVFRYERPQRGRLREHWQLNADLFGVTGIEADVEIISLAAAIMREFGANEDDFEIRINDRETLREKFKDKELIKLLDRKDKMEEKDFIEAWKKISDKMPDWTIEPGKKVSDVSEILEKRGVKTVFAPTLVRGFDYYTGIIFEVFDKNPKNNRSLFGGGRYDNLLELFDESPIPAVGFGMGDVTIRDFLELRGLLPTYRPSTQVYLVPVAEVDMNAVLEVASELRKRGVNVAVDLTDKKVGDKIKLADKNSIPFAVFVGEAEISSGIYKCKDLKTHSEQSLSIEEIAKSVKNL